MGMMMRRNLQARRAADNAAHKAHSESPEVREISEQNEMPESKVNAEKRKGGRPRKGV